MPYFALGFGSPETTTMLNATGELVSSGAYRARSTLLGNWFQAGHFITGEKKPHPKVRLGT